VNVDALLEELFETVSFDQPGEWEDAPELGEEDEAELRELELRLMGGTGSGNFGHAGRPGQKGGSSKQKHTTDQIAMAWSMKQKGHTGSEIQQATGLHPSTQYHHFKQIQKKQQVIAAHLVATQKAEDPNSIAAVKKELGLDQPSKFESEVHGADVKKAPAHYYWKKNKQTGKYEKTLTTAGKAAQTEAGKKAEASSISDLKKAGGSVAKQATLYGYTWEEKKTGPQAGKYAWFKDGIQQSAAADGSDSEKAATTMHYGAGPKKAQLLQSAEGWPIGDDVIRKLGFKYPEQVTSHGAAWRSSLMPQEQNAIEHYTGSGYDAMNQQLRNGMWTDKTKAIQTALAKAPAPPPPQLVWRGLGHGAAHLVANLSTGDEVQLNGFQSSSIKPTFAAGWAGGALLEILPKAGAFVRPLSQHKGEWEYLLPHGKKYKVRGITKVALEGSGKLHTVIQLEMQ
jgi:hypothetical protein